MGKAWFSNLQWKLSGIIFFFLLCKFNGIFHLHKLKTNQTSFRLSFLQYLHLYKSSLMSRKLQRLFTSTSLAMLSHAPRFFSRASIWIDMKLLAVLSARDSETRAGQNNPTNKIVLFIGYISLWTLQKKGGRNNYC